MSTPRIRVHAETGQWAIWTGRNEDYPWEFFEGEYTERLSDAMVSGWPEAAVVALPEPEPRPDGDLLWVGDAHDVRTGPSLPTLPGRESIAIERGQDVIDADDARVLAGMLLAAAGRVEPEGGEPR